MKVSQSFETNAHGAGTHTILGFLKYFSKDYQVDLIGCEVYPKEFENNKIFTPIKYNNLPRILKKILHIPVSIVNTIIYTYKEKPDLLFAPGGVFYNGLGVLIAGKLFGVKTLIRTAEDHFNYYKFCENWNCRLKHFFITNLISGFVLKRADYVLTVGEKSKEYFITKGIEKEKIFGIPGPISQVDFSMDISKSELRKELGLPLNKTIVLYAGAISGMKGTDELPIIMEKVLNVSNQFYFCIIGSETNGNKITSDILKAGKESVSLLSPKSQNELKKYFNACDILVFLTKIGVGYGQITIEATKANLPVVSYNSGLDVKWFMKNNCFDSINEIVEYLLSKKYFLLELPVEFTDRYIEAEHIKMMKDVMEVS